MAISEAARSDLYTGLRDVLGSDRAETLMGGLALHEFDVVATKADIAELRTEIAQLQRTLIGWMVSLYVATVGAVIGVAFLG